ncbi:MAG: metalloregulator ArsR/SmtB family transcription factor [Pseudorhodoplanes sp.]|nr:metalloregulator ArsR/SmtB family transcription factor [Pseudorhodoplanes sp.]
MDSAIEIEIVQDHATTAAGLLKAFSNPHRLRLVCVLYRGEKSVSELADELDLSQSNLSQHLAYLRRAKLVSAHRKGVSKVYSLIEHPAHDVLQILESVCRTH